jgi:hypothetical protein
VQIQRSTATTTGDSLRMNDIWVGRVRRAPSLPPPLHPPSTVTDIQAPTQLMTIAAPAGLDGVPGGVGPEPDPRGPHRYVSLGAALHLYFELWEDRTALRTVSVWLWSVSVCNSMPVLVFVPAHVYAPLLMDIVSPIPVLVLCFYLYL